VSDWRSGDFDRSRISGVFHPFTPAHAAESLEQVNLQHLWDRGKRLILLDVDNTLVEWKGENFSPTIIEWLEKAKAIGFKLCILSNTRRVERLYRITKLLGIETVRGRFKPSRAMYRLALIKFQVKAHEAIMIGDQMMTDILGANRAGIDAIWVRKMAAKEFGGTRVNRFIEKLLTSVVYEALITPIDKSPGTPEEEAAKPLREKTVVQQFIQFGIVGATSFAVDFAITWMLMHLVPFKGGLLSDWLGHILRTDWPQFFSFADTDPGAALPILGTIASLFAMYNSFIWNRKWTFEVKGKERKAREMRRFFIVSFGGLFINNTVATLMFKAVPSVLIGKAVGAIVAAAWNFAGSRFYAFKK